jgi:DNA-binding transcriptional ArsR family regulator
VSADVYNLKHMAADQYYNGSPDEEEEPDGEPTPLDQMRAALLDTAGLDNIPEPDPLVADLLYTNGEAWVVGKAGHGKSFVALDIAGCVGTGTDWHGHKVTRGQVLYVVAEGATGMRKRVRAWEQAWGKAMTDVHWLPLAVQVKGPAWFTLIELAAEMKPALIVLDTQARITVGIEENSAQDMGEFVHRLEQLREASRACVAVVHHQGRNGDHMRGSTALDGAADTVIAVSKDDEMVTVRNTKQKNAEEHEDIELRLVPIGESAVLMLADGKPGDRSSAFKTAARWWNLFGDDQVSASKVVEAEIVSKPTFYRHVAALLKADLVVKVQAGRATYYQLLRDPDEEWGAE